MSCYNWEQGSIKIPSKQWKRFRDSIVGVANERQERLYNAALKIHKALSDKAFRDKVKDIVRAYNKKQKVKDRVKLSSVTPNAIFDALNDSYGYGPLCRALKDHDYSLQAAVFPDPRPSYGGHEDHNNYYDDKPAVEEALFPYILNEKGWRTNKRKRLVKPKKKDFAKVSPTKVTTLQADSGSLTFEHASKRIVWRVDENNRAVESARASWLGEALFDALSAVSWTRGSGGKFIGNDEYNRHEGAEYEGGGGSYVTAEYGPNVKRPRYSRY